MENIKKKIIGFLLCFTMIVGLLPTMELQAAAKKDTTYYQDYERAFWKGYLLESYKKQKKTKQVTIEEYRNMLRTVIKQQKGNLKTFDKNVKKTKRKMTRGEAIIMSWYAAQALKASFDGYDCKEIYNNEQFWDVVKDNVLKKEFPNVLKKKKVKDEWGNVWDNEYVAAYLWNAWSSSVRSKIPVVSYSGFKDMQTMKKFTMEDAVSAVTRLCDGLHASKNYVELTSKKATTPTLNLKKKAKVKKIEDLPRLTGFVLNAFDREDVIFHTPEDVANVANWGFTSARVMVNYHMFFDNAVNKVDLNQLERLDELVAAAEHYGIHLNVLMYQLPGRESWADENYNSGGDFDLFVNEQKREKACDIWRLIAARYKDVPGDYLSFTPFWEAMNKNLSTGAEAPDYGSKDVVDTLDQIITAMRMVDKDCFIQYELTANNGVESIMEECREGYDRIHKKYSNTLISYNYCECPFVYHNMTATQGENIDNNNHSMYLPEYPNIIYSAREHFSDDSTVTMDGFLPKGTEITLYLGYANGKFMIKGDDKTLYEESFQDKTFKTSYLLSSYYPYATSDKKIVIQLKEDVEKVSFVCKDGWVRWSGMDVTLPTEYAQEKWYSISSYDRYLQGDEDIWKNKYEKRSTSNIMICPNDYNVGNHLTIHKDLTYTSENQLHEVGEKFTSNWGKAINELSGNCVIRYEGATFSNGATQKAMLAYYDTLLTMYDKYNFSWYSNDYELIQADSDWKTPDAKLVKYGKYEHFNMELLKLLQKHK